MITGQWISRFAMKAFIGAVIILGLFGPYMISIILGLLCFAAWIGSRDHVGNDDGIVHRHYGAGPPV